MFIKVEVDTYTKVLKVLGNRGGPEELSRQGVSGTSGDADGNEGTIPTPACQGHRDCTGGWQPPPPTVPLVQHAGSLESS